MGVRMPRLLGCIESYNPDSGNLFLTYVASAIQNAMIDYIRSQNVSFEPKSLSSEICTLGTFISWKP